MAQQTVAGLQGAGSGSAAGLANVLRGVRRWRFQIGLAGLIRTQWVCVLYTKIILIASALFDSLQLKNHDFIRSSFFFVLVRSGAGCQPASGERSAGGVVVGRTGRVRTFLSRPCCRHAY